MRDDRREIPKVARADIVDEEIMARLGDAASAVDEVHGFRYFDDRDLLGFVDGTENPRGVGRPPGNYDRPRSEIPSVELSFATTAGCERSDVI
jgi:deferrochelatase/peroxidase EfeB